MQIIKTLATVILVVIALGCSTGAVAQRRVGSPEVDDLLGELYKLGVQLDSTVTMIHLRDAQGTELTQLTPRTTEMFESIMARIQEIVCEINDLQSGLTFQSLSLNISIIGATFKIDSAACELESNAADAGSEDAPGDILR